LADAILIELALLFALCTGVAIAFHRLRLPPIVGFLVTGALVGPNAAAFVHHEELVHRLAEVGVVVLLFAVGMEVPLDQLARLRRTIAIGGGLQIAGTVLATALACLVAGLPWNQSLFLGFLLSMSSTAVVTKLLVDHGEFATPQGRLAVGIAIAQDLAVVPMILLMPLLGGGSGGGGILQTLESFAWLVGLLIAARLLVPRVLRLVARTRSRELFVLTLLRRRTSDSRSRSARSSPACWSPTPSSTARPSPRSRRSATRWRACSSSRSACCSTGGRSRPRRASWRRRCSRCWPARCSSSCWPRSCSGSRSGCGCAPACCWRRSASSRSCWSRSVPGPAR
jgi:hypothetical protein